MTYKRNTTYTTHKTYSTYSLAEFVLSWDFENPKWENLPPGFPHCDKRGLTKQEGHLLDGIKLAWLTSEGRGVFYKSLARRTVVLAVLIFVVLLGRSVLTSTDKSVAQSVSAKTVTQAVEDFVEATMSAVFRK